MSSQTPPKELQQKLISDPRLWVRNYTRHPNRASQPYNFYTNGGEDFLYYIADEDGPLNPRVWGDICVLLFARGCLKTWSCTRIAGWALDMYNSIEATATAPRQNQTGEVVSQFKKVAEESGMSERYERNKMSHQQFKNRVSDPDTGEEYTAYSELKSRSAWDEGDGLRGLHSQLGIIDEFQDVDEGTFSVFLEAIDQSVPNVPFFPTIFVIGTPKMKNSFFHELWQMSDQKTWNDDNREWAAQSEGNKYAPEGAAEDEGYSVRGWHIDQPSCPLHDSSRIEFKRQTYSKRKFSNEVMAQFYSAENDLLTSDNIHMAMDDTVGFQTKQRYSDTKSYIGVDWGGGDGEGAAKTAIVVGEETVDDEGLFISKIDVLDSSLTKQDEIERVEEYIMRFEADAVVVDEGYGSKSREDLQDGNGTIKTDGYDNVYGCQYGNVKEKESVKWNKKERSKQSFFTVNRTHMIESFVEDMKDGNIEIAADDMNFESKHDLGTMVVDNLEAPYTDRVETADGKKKLKVISDRNDDIFHAFTYLWLAANMVGSQRTLRSIGTHRRKGY